MKQAVYEIIGWAGTAAVLAAYALSSLGVVGPKDVSYILLNLFGGAALALVSFRKKSWQTLVVNIVWTVVAVTALTRSFI